MTEPAESAADTLNVLVIVGLRIYDALMLANAERNPDATEALRQKHANGEFIGPLPMVNENPFDMDEG